MTESRLVVAWRQEMGMGAGEGCIKKGCKEPSEVMEMFTVLIVVTVLQKYTYVKTVLFLLL